MSIEQPNLQRRGLLKVILAFSVAPAIIKIGILDRIVLPKEGDLVLPKFTLMTGEMGACIGFTITYEGVRHRYLDHFAKAFMLPKELLTNCKLQDEDSRTMIVRPDYGQLLFKDLKDNKE